MSLKKRIELSDKSNYKTSRKKLPKFEFFWRNPIVWPNNSNLSKSIKLTLGSLPSTPAKKIHWRVSKFNPNVSFFNPIFTKTAFTQNWLIGPKYPRWVDAACFVFDNIGRGKRENNLILGRKFYLTYFYLNLLLSKINPKNR